MCSVNDFFGRSDVLDHMALRPLCHIRPNWELQWDHGASKYVEEGDSFSSLLNEIIIELEEIEPPAKYHDNEDRLAEFAQQALGLRIRKIGNRWVGADYAWILEKGGWDDVDQEEQLLAIKGRIIAAIRHGQYHFDMMEESHQQMLASIIANVIYHRAVSRQ